METPFFNAGLAFLASLPQDTIVFLAAKDMGKDIKDVTTLAAAGLNPSLVVANRVFKTGDMAFMFNQDGPGSTKVITNMKEAVSALLAKQIGKPLPKAASLRVAAERFWGCFLDMPQTRVDESFMQAACKKLKVQYKPPAAAGSEPKAVTEARSNAHEADKQLKALSSSRKDIASICAATKKLAAALPAGAAGGAGADGAAQQLIERVTGDLAQMEAGLQAAKKILEAHVATVKAAHPSRIDVLLKALDEALRAGASEGAQAAGAGQKRAREEDDNAGKDEEGDPNDQQPKAGGDPKPAAGGDCVVQ